MAGQEHILNTIIQLRYDTYSHWMNSRLILQVGEAAICSFPNNTIDNLSNDTPSRTPPAIGIKIGDGRSYFYELPWLQAVAADVYSWAKSSTPPNAASIPGLAAFIDEHVNIGGDVTITPRIYQIVEGTDENANKYFLQYRDADESNNWVIDANHPIDLTPYSSLRKWIGERVLSDKTSLANFTADQTRTLLSYLANSDNTQEHYFVTRVTQTNGLIDVTRAQPEFSDIKGTATVSQGGTGLKTIPYNSLLISDGTETLSTIPLSDELDNSTSLVPSSVIKSYIDSSVAGLVGAMHFIGEATVVIRNNSNVNPNITLSNGNAYDFSQALPGDVILYEQKEFVWDGGKWVLLGDEGSYAVKGSIKNEDIAENANISQDKINNLSNTFDSKVDKVEGKSLTSNDFTDALKEKLDNIEDNAEQNAISRILVNNVPVPPKIIEGIPKSVNLEINEFDSASQDKLAQIEAEAERNVIVGVKYDTTLLAPDENRIVTILPPDNSQYENVIEEIYINNKLQTIQNKQVHIVIDQEALNLNVVAGAQIPKEEGSGKDEITQINKKLQFNRIAVTGDVKELTQLNDTYIVLDCGTSNSDAHV